MEMARRRAVTERDQAVVKGIRTQDWMPSSPTRNPTHALYIRWQGRLFATSYCACFAAKKAFDLAVDGDEYKWIDHRTVQTSRGVTISSDELEEIVEYDYSKEEQEWDFPDNDRRSVLVVVRPQTKEEREARNQRLGVNDDSEPRERPAKKERVPRASKEGLTTIQQIAQELKAEAGDCRAVLRKKKIDKPDVGWAWEPAKAAEIRAMLQKELT